MPAHDGLHTWAPHCHSLELSTPTDTYKSLRFHSEVENDIFVERGLVGEPETRARCTLDAARATDFASAIPDQVRHCQYRILFEGGRWGGVKKCRMVWENRKERRVGDGSQMGF